MGILDILIIACTIIIAVIGIGAAIWSGFNATKCYGVTGKTTPAPKRQNCTNCLYGGSWHKGGAYSINSYRCGIGDTYRYIRLLEKMIDGVMYVNWTITDIGGKQIDCGKYKKRFK